MMNFITKNFPLIVLILMLLAGAKSCSDSVRMNKIERAQAAIIQKIDSIAKINFLLTDAQIRREGFNISKRMLYDNNSVIRTKERPDDIMIEYDVHIEACDKEIKALKGEK